MSSGCEGLRRYGAVGLLALLAFTTSTQAGDASKPALRWSEGRPGCTFSADDDGKYRYGLWTDDFGIVVAVDAQELQKAARRTEAIFALLLTAQYRGKDFLRLRPGSITLEFVKHDHAVQPAAAPDDLARQFQADADSFAAQIEREVRKHPEKKSKKESELQAHQANVSDMLQFLHTRSLRALTLDSGHPEASGWVFFSAKSKWIGDWKKQEEFVLRIPLAEQVIEFPFALPPSQGDLLLRRRP